MSCTSYALRPCLDAEFMQVDNASTAVVAILRQGADAASHALCSGVLFSLATFALGDSTRLACVERFDEDLCA